MGKKVKPLAQRMKKLVIKYGKKTLFKGNAFMVDMDINREVFTLRGMDSRIIETVPANNFTVTVKGQCWQKPKV
jgi:hypothetical protein